MVVHALNHIILTVTDIEGTKKFYSDLLDFEITDVPNDFHNLAYFELEHGASVWFITHGKTPSGDRFSEFRVGLDHLAFSAPSKAFLEELATKLIAAGVETKGVELFQGKWWYIAFRDPDNIQLEYWLNEPTADQE